MSEQEQVYPPTTKEVAAQRKSLTPKPAEAFKAFSKSVFAGGALLGEDQAVDRRGRRVRDAMPGIASVGIPPPSATRPRPAGLDGP